MIEVPTFTLSSYDDILHYYIGAIVVGMQKVDQSFSRIISEADIQDAPEEFMRRKELWSRTAKAMPELQNAVLLAELKRIESALDKMHQLRDALVHGSPSVEIWNDPVIVECRLNPSRKRYRQAFIKNMQRFHRVSERYKSIIKSARMVARAGTYPLEISYELEEVSKAPQVLRKLMFDINNFTLKIWQQRHSADIR